MGQHLGLEAAHLAGGGRLSRHGPATDDPAHGRIVRQPVRIVHILVACQAPEHGLAELSNQGVASVRAGAGVRQNVSSGLAQTKGIVEFAAGQQTTIGRDLGAVELQLQAGIERDPESGSVFFTRCTVHLQPTPAPLMPTTPLKDNRNSGFQITASCAHRRVEDGRGGLGHAATLRFPSPLIKPDVRISRIRLSDWFHLAAHGGGPSSVRAAEAVGDGRRAQQHRSASVFAAG